jgi:uncharacterized membrane protein
MDPQVPLHPAVVHFPVALLLVGLLFELAGRIIRIEWCRRAAAALLILGAMGAGAAFYSGNAAEEAVEDAGVPHEPIERHEDAGKLAAILAGVAAVLKLAELTVLRKKAAVGWLVLAAYLAAAASVSVAALRGGELVYKHLARTATATPAEGRD